MTLFLCRTPECHPISFYLNTDPLHSYPYKSGLPWQVSPSFIDSLSDVTRCEIYSESRRASSLFILKPARSARSPCEVKVCSLLEGEFFRVPHQLRNTFVVDICPTFRLPQSEMCALLLSSFISHRFNFIFLFFRHFIVRVFVLYSPVTLSVTDTVFVF